MRSFVPGLFLLGFCAACSSGTEEDESSGGTGANGATTSGTGQTTGSGAAQPLTDHELFLVGVWRGTISESDQEYAYIVLNEDRTGCGWDRHGDDFGTRYFAWSFDDWRLEEAPLDADGRMTIKLRADGSEQSIERYDPETDNVYIGGLTRTTWQSVLIPCDAPTTNATATDVARRGSAP
jgi:hypothetical protein